MKEYYQPKADVEQEPSNYTELSDAMRKAGFSDTIVGPLVEHYSDKGDFAGALEAFHLLMETKDKKEALLDKAAPTLGKTAVEEITHLEGTIEPEDRSFQGDLRVTPPKGNPENRFVPPKSDTTGLPAGISPEELRARVALHLNK